MAIRFVQRKIFNKKPPFSLGSLAKNENIEENNELEKNDDVMTTKEKIEAANSVLATPVKRIKKDKGLIERTESSVTVLTEDNKELLKD